MPFQPAPDLAEVIVKGDLDQEDAFVTLGFVNLTAWKQDELQALADGIEGWWFTEMLPNLPNVYTYRETVARDLRTQNGYEATASSIIGGTGGLLGAAMPNNVTLAISFRTGRIGRSSRGRNYIPGIQRADVNLNEVVAARINSYEAAYNQLLAGGYIPINWAWVVISRWSNNALRPAATSTPVVSVTVTDPIIDSQRRRLPTRGD